MKNYTFFLSKHYNEFKNNRQNFHISMIKGIRISLSVIIIFYMIMILSLSDHLPIYNYILPPVILIFNTLLTNLVIRKNKWGIVSHFLTFQISIMLAISIEIGLPLEAGDELLGIILGIKFGLVFSIFLLSKLPFLNLVPASILALAHTLIRCNRKASYPLNSGLQILGTLLLLVLYYRQEALDFKIFLDLQKKHKSLLRFEELIKNFPNEIIILNHQSLKTGKPVYMNDEAKRLEKKAGSFRTFLESFMIEEVSEDEPELSKKNLEPPCLLDKIKKLIKQRQDKFSGFEIFLAKYVDKSNKSIHDQQGQNISNIFESERDYIMESQMRETLSNEDPTKFEIRAGFVDWGENEEEALIISLNNISYVEKIRELKLLHKNKDIILANISHGLKTPLNGVIGMLEEADSGLSDKNIKNSLSIAKSSAHTLLLMISDILDHSQMKKGTLNLKKEYVNIKELIESIVPMITLQVQIKNIDLRVTNKCPPDTIVIGDFIRLQQILYNILSNSYKFTNEGHILIDVHLEKIHDEKFISSTSYDEGEDVVISISDTGRGIKEENFPKLFTLFGKFEMDGNETGVGLGLAVSQKLAKIMTNKGIQFRSEYGKGSTFWMNLRKENVISPAAVNNIFSYHSRIFRKLPNESERNFEEIPNKIHPRLPRVLVVDDDQINHVVAENYLKNIGKFALEKAFNGVEALKYIIEAAKNNLYFDIVLMDINMPIMDGNQATQEIIKLVKEGRIPDVPIIAITANVDEENKNMYLKKGVKEVISKPVNKNEFKRIILEYTDKVKNKT